jgi:hypothetical protein
LYSYTILSLATRIFNQLATSLLQVQLTPRGSWTGDSVGDDVKERCDLEALATEFVSKLPDKKFSSAAVQGFLLTKTDPREAVRDIPS